MVALKLVMMEVSGQAMVALPLVLLKLDGYVTVPPLMFVLSVVMELRMEQKLAVC